jgi:hypothetical protein
MDLGRVLVAMQEHAARLTGADSGRIYYSRLGDLQQRSGLSVIDKRERLHFVRCFEHREVIGKWLRNQPRAQRPKDPRQIWRKWRAEVAEQSGAPVVLRDEVGEPAMGEDEASAPTVERQDEAAVQEEESALSQGRLLGAAVYPAGTFAAWLAERCCFGQEFRAGPVELYDDYVVWMRNTPEQPLPRKGFSARLAADPDINRTQLPGGQHVFRGLALKADCAQLDEWLAARCKRGPRLCQSSRDLWRDFREWIEARGGIGPAERVFVARLAAIEGLRRSAKLPDGLRGFRGVCLKESAAARRGDDETALTKPLGYRFGDEYGPLAYVLVMEGLQGSDLAVETGMAMSIWTAQRVMRKPAGSARFEEWCRSTVQRIFAQVLEGSDARQIARGLTAPEGWPAVPERAVERIRDRLAAAPDNSAVFRFREQMLESLALGGGPLDDRASEIDQPTSTPDEGEIIQFPRRTVC